MTESELPTCPRIFDQRGDAALEVAREAAQLIATRARAGLETVLGLATGSTPLAVYAEWIRMHRAGELDFASVRSFNLDEFLGLERGHPLSFRATMQRALFEHVNMRPEAIGIPDSMLASEAVPAAAARYEEAIRDAGGIDLQLLGIGRNGHIGFNEPGSARDSRTREVELHALTRADAAAAFGSLEAVPRRAVTMGIATILEARRLRVMAFGAGKRAVLAQLFAPGPAAQLPARWLFEHPDLDILVDREAADASEAREG